MNRMIARTCFAALTLWLACSAQADVRLPALFSDHMVLQQGQPVPVWGWADPGEEVSVSIAGRTLRTVAGDKGRWRVDFDALEAAEPLVLAVRGKNEIVVRDVLVGEVWLCAGQSNMEMSVSGALDAGKERAAADHPRIRMFRVARQGKARPAETTEGEWVVCSPGTVLRFSAVAYFFGRDVHEAIGAPVGLINSSWGGTLAEAWTSLDALATIDEFKPVVEKLQGEVERPWDEAVAMAQYEKRLAEWEGAVAKARAEEKPLPRRPREPVDPRLRKSVHGNLFNGMVAPLIPYAIRGAIWYQGESNALRPHASLYSLQLETLVKDWRSRWGYDFPFAWVQLPEWTPRNETDEHNWSVVREEMVKALRIPRSGMAVTLGLGDPDDIHPKAKRGVGRRLALWALAEVYGRDVSHRSPLYAGHEVRGREVVVSFDHIGGGLRFAGGEAKGFEVAGADRRFAPADARIEGDRVIVSSPEVADPVAVRYAWAANPKWSLVSGAGLHASPFRTDNWSLAAAPPKRANVPRARAGRRNADGLRLDGKLDEPFWEGLASYELNEVGTGKRPAAPTAFKLAWADGSLVVGVRCAEPNMASLAIAATRDGDTNIWEGDCLELLIETQDHSYYQIAVSPAGAVVELDRKDGLQYLWSSGAEAASHLAQDFWSVELRIPLPPEGELDVFSGIKGNRPTSAAPWFFNLCRQRPRGEKAESSHFAGSSAKGFHDVANFARLAVE